MQSVSRAPRDDLQIDFAIADSEADDSRLGINVRNFVRGLALALLENGGKLLALSLLPLQQCGRVRGKNDNPSELWDNGILSEGHSQAQEQQTSAKALSFHTRNRLNLPAALVIFPDQVIGFFVIGDLELFRIPFDLLAGPYGYIAEQDHLSHGTGVIKIGVGFGSAFAGRDPFIVMAFIEVVC